MQFIGAIGSAVLPNKVPDIQYKDSVDDWVIINDVRYMWTSSGGILKDYKAIKYYPSDLVKDDKKYLWFSNGIPHRLFTQNGSFGFGLKEIYKHQIPIFIKHFNELFSTNLTPNINGLVEIRD